MIRRLVDKIDEFLLLSGILCIFKHMWRVSSSKTEYRKNKLVVVSHEICMKCLRQRRVVLKHIKG
jgi:uncharacterized membrane protein SirB2